MTATPARHEWNTGRLYTAEGQRIIAEVTATGVHFYDMSRGVGGTVALPTYSTLSDTYSVRQHVMAAYDHNRYASTEESRNLFLRLAGYAI
jgi:hypothetical protein